MVFSGFLYQYDWLPRYNWIIIESDIKHHKPNQTNYNDLIRNGQQFNKMENDLWPQIIEHKKYHADRNPDSGFEQQQEQKCGRVKEINGIKALSW